MAIYKTPGDFGGLDEQAAMAEVFANMRTQDFECDVCQTVTPAADRHEARLPRPSDPSCYSAVMYACPTCAPNLGAETVAYWERFADENGYFLD